MSLNPEDSRYFFNLMTEELDDLKEDFDDFSQKIAAKEAERNKEREERIQNIRKEASDAYRSTQIGRCQHDKEYAAHRKRREKEMILRKAEERQQAADRKEEWEEFQTREIKSSELRQQYLDRDSLRDKLERQDKVDKFKDLLDHKKSYDDGRTKNNLMLMEKHRNSQLQITDAETRKFKAQEDSNRAALIAADARKGSNEVNLAAWQSCERTVTKAIEHGIPTRKKGNSIVFF